MDRSQRSAQSSAGSRASAENRGHSSGHQDKDEQTRQAARYNRVRVQDLLNDEHSSRSHSSLSKDSGEAVCLVEGCGKKFFAQKSLVVHQKRSHAAPTDFICHLCRCSFSSIPNLNKHIRSVHDKVRPHQCVLCRATFAFRDGLQRHVEMVHDQNRPFSCTYCSMKFKTKAHLNKHHMTIHPGIPVDPTLSSKYH